MAPWLLLPGALEEHDPRPGPNGRDASFADARAGPGCIVRGAERVVMLVGAYGSGKTEVAVNLALSVARTGRPVQLADLDLVNPYFRSREVRRPLEAAGVRVVVPPGAQAYADLPIVLPEIRGLLTPPPGVLTILDVGGDDVGARVLSSFRPVLQLGGYELWQVINANRPFTSTVAGCLRMRDELEAATRLRVTGLVGNTHLSDETTAATVRGGARLTATLAERSGLPVRCLTAMRDVAAALDIEALPGPLMPLERHMLPPWLVPARDPGTYRENETREDAARPIPIGVPPQIRSHPPRGGADGPHRD